ncbi:MAG: sulfatase-like hydrolase/transferase [Candidatus Lokiarchaeota archaeon]
MSNNNIKCYGIHSNPNLSKFFNYDRGFEIFLDGERYKVEENEVKDLKFKTILSSYIKKVLNHKDLLTKLMYRLIGFNRIKGWIRKRFPRLTELILPFTPIAYNAPFVVNKSIRILQKNKGPLFMWLHFMDVHSPYNPPNEHLDAISECEIQIKERDKLVNEIYLNPENYQITEDIISKLKTLYDGELHFVDYYLGMLYKYINEKYKNNCLIIITADHGESFFEHGYFNHQGSIFDELLKIPLIIIEPGKNLECKIINDYIQMIDIAPTILDYFSINIPEYYKGKSLIPLIENQGFDRPTLIISETYQKDGKMKRNNQEGFKLISLRTQKWKYISDEEKDREYLFNLQDDPKEKNNLIHENKSQAEIFRNILQNHLNEVRKKDEKSKIMTAIGSLNLKKNISN